MQKKIQKVISHHCSSILDDLSIFNSALVKLRFEGRQNFKKNLKNFSSILEIIKNRVAFHTNLEEQEVFPYFDTSSNQFYSIRNLFCLEHKELKTHLDNLTRFIKRNPKSINAIYHEGTYLFGLGKSHFGLESKRFYELLEKNLNSDSKDKLYRIIKSNF